MTNNDQWRGTGWHRKWSRKQHVGLPMRCQYLKVPKNLSEPEFRYKLYRRESKRHQSATYYCRHRMQIQLASVCLHERKTNTNNAKLHKCENLSTIFAIKGKIEYHRLKNAWKIKERNITHAIIKTSGIIKMDAVCTINPALRILEDD